MGIYHVQVWKSRSGVQTRHIDLSGEKQQYHLDLPSEQLLNSFLVTDISLNVISSVINNLE
jgi:hypothetical protein